MIIWIDETVLKILTSDIATREHLKNVQKINQAMTQIVDGRKNHRHIIWGEQGILERIRDYYMTNEGEKSEKYKELCKVLRTYKIKKDKFKKILRIFYTKVVCDNSSTCMNDNYININILDCPNQLFDFFLNQTILLFENNDDELYYYNPIAIKYCKENGYGIIGGDNNTGLILDYDDRQTGGSTVKQAIRNKIIKMNCFCMGLTDSDNEYGTIPSSGKSYQIKEGATQLKFQKIATLLEENSSLKGRKIDNYLYKYHVLEVRDVENLIPINTIQQYCYPTPNPNSNTVFNNIERIKSILGQDETKIDSFYRYFDFENGIQKKFDEKGNENVDEILFWKEVLCITDGSLPIHNICSKDFLKDRKFVETCPPITKLPMVLQTEWSAIGELILSFCCAYKENL